MAALIVVALLTLFAMGWAGVVAMIWVVRAQRADRMLREDLDQALAAILEGAAPSQKFERPNSTP